jgi:hypothetical protein
LKTTDRNFELMSDEVIKDGTSQEDRTMPALDEGYINVDEMSFSDLLAMAADYARILKFYDFDSKGTLPSGD